MKIIMPRFRAFTARFSISISMQILIFMVLIAFLPIAVMMMLNTYEKQQLISLENAIVQQGRLVAASLSAAAQQKDSVSFNKDTALLLLQNMNQQFDSRIRIVDKDGLLLADSAVLVQSEKAEKDSYSEPSLLKFVSDERNAQPETDSSSLEKPASENWLYRLFSLPVRIYRKLFNPPAEPRFTSADFYTGKQLYDGPEILSALQGRYGAITRISTGGQISVTLYSAVPVLSNGNILGVVLVSRSTYRILQNLYELRLDLARIFVWSLLAVLFVTIYFASHITLPLKKLSAQASLCADKRGRIISTQLAGARRSDEIGALSRSFTVLLEKLDARIKFIEAFSADVSHEFKNPLAAIRSAAELTADLSLSEEERRTFCNAITEEVEHLQQLLSGVRKISSIDGASAEENIERIPVDSFLENTITRIKKRYPDIQFSFSGGCEDKKAAINADWFDRLIENLLDNAATFAGSVFVSSSILAVPDRIQFIVEDSGPGILAENYSRIFDRFYSLRGYVENDGKAVREQPHTGLGLSIVKAVTEAAGGSISVGKSEILGGAYFCVQLPLSH